MFASPAPSRPEFQKKWVELRQKFNTVPDDTELRLRYASEWVKSEEDSARARLIQVQVRLDALEGGVAHPAWLQLRGEAEELLLNRAERWVPEWFAAKDIRNPIFYRGFIEGVVANIQTLLNPHYWEGLFTDVPLRHLDIVGVEDDSDLEHLLNRSELRQLVSLSIVGQGLSDPAMRMIALESNLHKLRWLSVANNHISTVGFEYLRLLSDLEYLDTTGNKFDCAEQLEEDQGIVVGRRPPQLEDFRALRRAVVGGRVAVPNRFELWRKHAASMSVAR
jgi:hypothetical protein